MCEVRVLLLLLFVSELCGIDWAVNKPRLERAIDEGFVRYVVVDPPAHPIALQDIPRAHLREEHRKLPVASKVCAAYLDISDSTYCDHHQKYHHVVWQKGRKDLDAQLDG